MPVLLYSPADKKIVEQRIRMNYPEIDEIKQIYRAIGNYYQIPVGTAKNQVFDFNVADFAARYKLSIMTIYSSLKFLQMEGYLELTEEIYNPSKLKFLVSRDELYKFQIANVDFDAFIKLILRTYTGLFTDYVTIYEESLANQANVKPELIIQYLKRLGSMGMIRYIPQKKTPVIIFTEERLDVKSLHISKEHYLDRKKEYIDRLDTLMEYASGRTGAGAFSCWPTSVKRARTNAGNVMYACRTRNSMLTNTSLTGPSEQARTLLRK